MKTNRFKFFWACLCVIAASICFSLQPSRAQSGDGLYGTLNALFDVNDTNSLINASEINLTPLAIWDSEADRFGGAVDLNWWVTDQQGAVLRFTQFGDREVYVSLGYKARTVFKRLEVGLGAGVIQNVDESLGDVKLYVQPSLAWKLPVKAADLRLYAGADICNSQSPAPFAGFSIRFSK
jgi:hypothetical protein